MEESDSSIHRAATKYPVTIKRPGWSTFTSLATVFVLLALWAWRPAVFLSGAFLALLAYALSVGIRFIVAQRYQLTIEDSWLVERDHRGKEIGRLNLQEPFEAQYLFKSYYDALYKVTQGNTRLKFSGETAGAPFVIQEILGLRWPPYGYRWWPLN